MDLIKIEEEAFATGKQHPSFKAGDTVTVAYRIVEGNKERVQPVSYTHLPYAKAKTGAPFAALWQAPPSAPPSFLPIRHEWLF